VKGLFALTIASVLLGGCGGGGQKGALFPKNWQNDGGVSIGKLEQRLRSAPRTPDANVAVGVTTTGLAARNLSTGQRWTYLGKAETLPVVAGGLVAFTSEGDVVALDAKNGRVVWKVSARGRKLRGAGDDGKFTILSLGASEAGESLLLVVDRKGELSVDAEPGVEIGRPTALGGVGFVPWGDQYVSAIDLEHGGEVGRLLLRDLVSHAFKSGGDIYFGERAVVRFDDKIRLADNAQATRAELEARSLPGNPRWLTSGLELPLIDGSARQKIRIYATPTSAGGRASFSNQAYLATYFKVAYGVAESGGKLTFARALSGDALGGAAAGSGFVVCDSTGRVTELDARGGLTRESSLDEPLRGCTVQASSLQIAQGKAAPLAEQLQAALEALEPDMAAAQGFLLTELAQLDDARVTKVLIDLASSGRLPAELRAEARKFLAARRTGVEHMLSALEQHYDFVSGALPPPVGPLADALAALDEKRGAAPLAHHLNDPANSIDDVERAARALGKLATPAEYRELRTFFALYRATADDPGLVGAVTAVAGALLRVGGEEGKALVERAASDPLTQPEVRRAISALLPQGAPEAQAAETN
jgi:outer membrane protein assembly factor BamB